MSKIRVLVVDDSALVRQMLTEMINSDPELEVVAAAEDPYEARELIKQLRPDVLTLDIEMPRMDGVSFLRNLMRLHPLPVVMVSTLTEHGAAVTLESLEIGAIDFVTKPKIDLENTFEKYSREICRKVKMASQVNRSTLERQYLRYSASKKAAAIDKSSIKSVSEKHSPDVILSKQTPTKERTADKIIAIGASTGGTEAIKEVLMHLPATTPAIVISQHIPATFSGPFALRMDSMSEMRVMELQSQQELLAGHVYIAPGNKHLIVERLNGKYFAKLNDGPPVNRHKPSVDVMFRSVAQNVGTNAVGVILTGMGADGAQGLKEIQEAGAPTIAQDKKSSVVWGMPGEAVKLNAADHVLSLDQVAAKILELVSK